jgi:hypothetical protein
MLVCLGESWEYFQLFIIPVYLRIFSLAQLLCSLYIRELLLHLFENKALWRTVWYFYYAGGILILICIVHYNYVELLDTHKCRALWGLQFLFKTIFDVWCTNIFNEIPRERFTFICHVLSALFACHGSGGCHRPLTAEARVRARVSPCGSCGGRSDTGTGFSPSSSVSPHLFHSTVALQSHIISSGGWTIGPLVAAV